MIAKYGDALCCSGVYNGVGVVKGHHVPGEPGAESRAPQAFIADP
jgi:hypothetical protein